MGTGFLHAFGRGPEAIRARGGGGWQPHGSGLGQAGSPEAAKLRWHVFQQPALLTRHRYSGVKSAPATSCCP